MNRTVTQLRSRLMVFLVGYWLPSAVSVVLNSFIIIISVRKNVINGSFKHFVCHLAVADPTVSMSIVFLQPLVVLGSPDVYWSPICDIAGTIHWIGLQTMILALALLAYNRYISICKGEAIYDAKFTKRKIAVMFGSIQGFCAVIGSFFWIDSLYFGHHVPPAAGSVCKGYIKYNSPLIRAGFSISGNVSLFALAATIYFVTCTKRKIRKHTNQVRAVLSEEKFKRNKNLVKALTTQLALALLAITPPAIIGTIPAVAERLYSPDVVQACMIFNPPFDAIATLMVAAPYRRVAINWCKQLRHGHLVLQDPANQPVNTANLQAQK